LSISSAKERSLKNSFKIVFLGNPNVGKTSIIRRILNLDLLSEYSPTIGLRYHNLDVQQNEIQYYLQLWDVSGNEVYSELIPSILKGVSVVVLVFDYKDTKSQNEFTKLYTKVLENVSPNQILLAGNKFENIKKEIPKALASWIKEHKLKIFPVSAKENTGKSLLLQKIIQILDDIPNNGKLKPVEVRIPHSE
jgi:small GTP-binding protein